MNTQDRRIFNDIEYETSKCKHFNFPEQLSLARAGDKAAYSNLVAHYLKFVSRIANKFARNFNLSVDDLFSIGCIGLIKAIDNFDQERGNTFLTFASTCIENEIKLGIRRHFKQSGPNVISYDSLFISSGDKEELSLIDAIADDGVNIEQEFEDKDTFRFCGDFLKQALSEKKFKICDLYFGFSGKQLKTMNDVANAIGCTRAYCQRIITEAKALVIDRLKHVEELDNTTL